MIKAACSTSWPACAINWPACSRAFSNARMKSPVPATVSQTATANWLHARARRLQRLPRRQGTWRA
nr:putative toluene monooxygenase subunit E [uncultured bacterium]